VIHYHGTPLTPRTKLLELVGFSFCVPWPGPQDLAVAHEIGESVMLDNGAFTLWQRALAGRGPRMGFSEWDDYYRWVEPWLGHRTTWAIIPDIIDGSEEINDALVEAWPHGDRGAPVWHMHESIDRLVRLCATWPRVCIGSSGEYADVGTPRWHRRMAEAMNDLCGDGSPPTWLHMLRGLKLADGPYPFASADSTDIARNHAGNLQGRVPQSPLEMARRIGGKNTPARWRRVAIPEPLPL
jgi:hypothetical protein